jgi:hypothetical protein
MLWPLLSALILHAQLWLLAVDPAGPLPPDLPPAQAMQLKPEERLRMYKRSRRDPSAPYRSLLIVRRDGGVTLRTLQHAAHFVLSAEQRSDLDDAIRGFDLRAFRKTPRKSPRPPSEEGDVDYFLSFRRGGGLVRWSNTQFEFPRPDPIFDCLEVYEYLARPAEPTP